MACCQYNFNSGTPASGKTRMAPKTSKTTTAWWLATNSKTTPVAMKCQINNELKPSQTWVALGKLVATYNFAASLFCTAQSLFRTILDPSSWWMPQSCDSYAAASCCRDVGPNGPNDKHSLEEHLWHVASTTSTVAPLRVARLGWLPRLAKLPLQDGWQRTPKLCHCSWKVKSTIWKAKLPQHKPGSPWENWSLPTTSQLHMFCTTWSLLRTILDPSSWWMPQSCDSYAAASCCRDVGPNGPNNKHSLEEHLWHVASTTSTVASLSMARLGWLPGQAKLPLQDGWQRTRKLCHCSWKVKSTIRKAELPQHKPGSPWENWSLPTTSQLHMFCTTWSLLRTILDPASCWLSQSCDSYAAAFAVEMWAKMGQITSTA